MADAGLTSYDVVPYPGDPFAQTHPDRLATLARLFGLHPAPVARCRVLELGCGDGGNLIPMAFGLPKSEFVGIDLAARPIAKGQAMVAMLGLSNITLRQLDLMQVSGDFGQFDYIMAHGVYSWISPPARDKLLAICKAHLAPHGVAYVSYNAYPGGHLRDMVREMMAFHVRQFDEPQKKIDQARALMKFLAEGHLKPDPYREFLREELERSGTYRDWVIYHDYLEETNTPVYFFQFVNHAAKHELQYLAEADLFEMQDYMYPTPVTEALRALATNQVVREQYLDFLKCRRFRQTLLCHDELAIDRTLTPDRMTQFYVASSARPTSVQPDAGSTAVEQFRGPKGAAMSTNLPLAKAAILQLGEIWPQAMLFGELVANARARVGHDSPLAGDLEQDAQLLGEILLKTYAAGLIELHLHIPHFVLKAGERPVVSPLARLQIQSGERVTNLFHRSVELTDPLVRQLLPLMDGTRDRATLRASILDGVLSGATTTMQEGRPVADRRKIEEIVTDKLEELLAKLGRCGLLVA